MVVAEVVCTCGHRFSVADDGNGAPHPCPRCHVQNVLPRHRGGTSGGMPEPPSALGQTGVRSTAVLSPAAAAHQSVVQGLPPGTVLGPYRIVRRIGRGGMGSVYEAVDDRSSQRVALKVLSSELAAQQDFVARFHRESRALSSFTDRRIAKVFFSGAAEGMPFFAMEYVDGRNLEEILAGDGPPKSELAIAWMKEIALGLNAAAERGLIHRDVKPTNVLIDREGAIRIVDFGLAKALDSDTRLTVTGAVVGTPFYLSPEQGLGRPVDQRSDIYSLGATFYHLLTRKPPFEADNSVSIILKHVNDPPSPIRDVEPRVPEPLARIVMRCMAKDPRHRYQDYDELIRDLDAARAGEPVAAPRESATIRKAPTFVVMDDLEEGSFVLRRASRFRRGLALLVDVGAIFAAVTLLDRGRVGDLELGAFAAPFAVAYIGFGDLAGGRTLGKKFLRLRVARPDGTSIGPLRGLLRLLLLMPLAVAVILVHPEFDGVARHFFDLLVRLQILTAWSASRLVAAVAEIRVPILGFVALDLALSLLSAKAATFHDLASGTAVFREELVKRRKKKASGRERPTSPRTALIASVLPGFGQLLNGEIGKGLAFFVGISLTLPAHGVGFLVWALAAFEAHRTATERMRRWEKENAVA